MRRIKAERLKKGWSQTVLAYKSSVSIADISKIELGRLEPYPSQRERLAKALHITPDQLTTEVSDGQK